MSVWVPGNVLVLNASQVRSAFSPSVALEAAVEAYRAISTKGAESPLRTVINNPSGATLFMPAASSDAMSLKIVAVRPGNARLGLPTLPASVFYLDPLTGMLKAILDGTELTAMRTAAGSGLATKLFAREDAVKLAIFGAGRQAEAHVDAVLHVRPLITTVHFCNRNVERARELATRLTSRYPKVAFAAVEDPAVALKGALVICTCTNSSEPLFDGKLVEAGAHLNLIGAYTPKMREVDSALVARSAVIVVDSTESALTEAGDLLTPLAKGVIGRDKLEFELGHAVAQVDKDPKVSLRPNSEAITLFKSCGHALQDLTAAKHVVANAEKSNLGLRISLF